VAALSLDGAGFYVAAAYLVFVTLVVVYVLIIGSKLAHTRTQLEDLTDRLKGDHR
jgi:heme exporter protein D